jgi:uncharacterized protein YdhG (YjbR/CyaY superfamily)
MIKTADEYIASQADDIKSFLEEVRAFIRSQVPKSAEECISYQVIAYKYSGMLVGFGVHKTGCSFFTMNSKLLPTIKDDLKRVKYAGTTIHLNKDEKIPKTLLKKIISIRIKENEVNALAKKPVSPIKNQPRTKMKKN